ncbi:MAG: hypothetical protein AVDCRST_MAG08-4468, partial [uncultured Acetobacteraceae bacterium]
ASTWTPCSRAAPRWPARCAAPPTRRCARSRRRSSRTRRS